jgi:foldase protein PrsA
MNSKLVIIIAVALVLVVAVAGVVAWQTGLFSKKAATVDGSPIYMSDIQKQLDSIAAQNKTAAQKKAFEQQKKQITTQLLDQAINDKVYVIEAGKMNITVTDKEIETELNNTIARFPSRAEFDKALKTAGMTMDDLRQLIKTRLLTDKVNKKVVGKITVTDKQAQDYYAKNATQFNTPETVTASHILVATEADAKAIQAQIIAGADFAALAKEKSTDTASKVNGGALQAFSKGQMVPEFETAAFAMQPGDPPQVVKTQFGWHVIIVTARTPEKQRTYEESKASIEQMLKSQQESAKSTAWLDGVKKKMTIKKYI